MCTGKKVHWSETRAMRAPSPLNLGLSLGFEVMKLFINWYFFFFFLTKNVRIIRFSVFVCVWAG